MASAIVVVMSVGIILAIYSLWQPTPPDPVATQLAQAIDSLPEQPAEAIRLAQDLLNRGDLPDTVAADCHWLIGAALIHQAQAAGPPPDRTKLDEADDHFQEAKKLGVSAERASRLAFQEIKLEYLRGGEPGPLARRLAEVLDTDPADRVEGYALLADMYLEQSQPDLAAALKANEKLLAQPELTDPNPARLQRGRILLRLRRPREAKQILARIPRAAKQAREAEHLQALAHFQQEDWSEAVLHWERVILDSGRPRFRPSALYHLGVCYLRLQRPSDAVETWTRLISESPGTDEAEAAHLWLGWELQRDSQTTKALGHYGAFLDRYRPTPPNPYVDPEVVRAVIERAWRNWLDAGAYGAARELAEHYRPFSRAGEADRWWAQAARRQAWTLLGEADQGGTDRRQWLHLARTLLIEAGDRFLAAARPVSDDDEATELLLAAARSFLEVREYHRALPLLQQLLDRNLTDADRVEAMVGLGEAYRALGEAAKARQILLRAIAKSRGSTYRARYLLGLALIDLGRLDDAESELRKLLVSPEASLADETPQVVMALVHILFRRGEYAEAAHFLQRHLSRPLSPLHRFTARYWLAEAKRRLGMRESEHIRGAETISARDFYEQLKRTYLEESLRQFEQLASELGTLADSRKLDATESRLLRDARFGMGDCLFHLGRYDDAIPVYQALAAAYSDRVHGLTAAMHLVQIFLTLRQNEEARIAIATARALLKRLPDSELAATEPTPPATGGKTTPLDRDAWEAWLDQAERLTRDDGPWTPPQ